MLSPRRMTKLNRDFAWLLMTMDARSYSDLSPVPTSPMAAKRTEFFRSGRVIVWAASDFAPAAIATTASNPALVRKRMRHEVDDEIGLDIADQEVVLDPAILQVFGQLG